MRKDDFKALSMPEQGMELMSKGKHLTQLRRGEFLLNLYSIGDFFVEVYYSVKSNVITKIEIVTDLTKIDQYIDANAKDNKLEGKVSLN
ncbi:MAG TPA: hypothetical protein P5132_00980 [Bacteroidales bacterium]|nr:hypothetical protein [Bacteroidales bacterium]